MTGLIRLLIWIGARARFVLALGCVAALFLPGLSAFLRPALPVLVAMVLALAIARLDLRDILRTIWTPARLTRTLGATLLLMPVTAAIYAALAAMFNLSEASAAALILAAAAPPIASGAGLCFLLGYNARLALEVTLVATALTPVIGPAIVALLVPEFGALSVTELALRLAAMIAGGMGAGALIRHLVGPARVAANKRVFDGVAALGMVLFVVPLFDGVGATILAHPGAALGYLALAVLINLGVTLLVRRVAHRAFDGATAGALGVIWGNRTIALYLATSPTQDPFFALFVALYQFPMYFTPLTLNLLGVAETDEDQT